MIGWIKVYREITEHWIWNDPVKLKWWLDLLLLVNHEEKKMTLGNNLITCSRGQTLVSLQNLSERWRVSRDSIRNFLIMLENDHMIQRRNLTKTTQITICNYDYYQDKANADQTQRQRQTKRKPNADQTLTDINKNIKNDKELKEDKEEGSSDAGSSLHKSMIKSYELFYESKVGIKYKFQGGQDGSALKTIREYITKAITDKNKVQPEGSEILQAWEFILSNYDKWEPFYQKQLKIGQINSNLPNIMANIKGINGKPIKPDPGKIISEISQIVHSADGKL